MMTNEVSTAVSSTATTEVTTAFIEVLSAGPSVPELAAYCVCAHSADYL
jgi:hypothetical protein